MNPNLEIDSEKIRNNNPQKKLFWDLYLNPSSDTFGNATRSAVMSGWTETDASNVSQQGWFKNGIRREAMKDKAEGVLSDMLDLPSTVTKVVKGETFVVDEPAMVKIKQDTAKYITSTLMKKHYSTRTENTGANGGPIKQEIEIDDEQFKNILNAYVSNKRGEGDKPKKDI
jgi:hypothetical protein